MGQVDLIFSCWVKMRLHYNNFSIVELKVHHPKWRCKLTPFFLDDFPPCRVTPNFVVLSSCWVKKGRHSKSQVLRGRWQQHCNNWLWTRHARKWTWATRLKWGSEEVRHIFHFFVFSIRWWTGVILILVYSLPH
jgi:hypothetical protein